MFACKLAVTPVNLNSAPIPQIHCSSLPQAGLASPDDPDQLLIALEPEAASFYCRTLQMKDFLGETGEELVNEGLASYVVIDNGGVYGIVYNKQCSLKHHLVPCSAIKLLPKRETQKVISARKLVRGPLVALIYNISCDEPGTFGFNIPCIKNCVAVVEWGRTCAPKQVKITSDGLRNRISN